MYSNNYFLLKYFKISNIWFIRRTICQKGMGFLLVSNSYGIEIALRMDNGYTLHTLHQTWYTQVTSVIRFKNTYRLSRDLLEFDFDFH